MRKVSNELPSVSLPRRLAIVGEAPGTDEVNTNRPFVGPSGQLLNAALQKYHHPRNSCYIGNISQCQPPGNDITKFAWEGPEIQSGLEVLRGEITSVNPNCILLLGKTALKAAGISHPISSYRGTVFICNETTSPFFNRKCIASYHPAYILRTYSDLPFLNFDTRRAIAQSDSPIWSPPQRNLQVDLSLYECIAKLRDIKKGDLISVDIEGGIVDQKGGKPSNVSMVGFSRSPTEAFVVRLCDFNNLEQEELWPELYRVLSDHEIFKILQNSLYDNFVMTWLWKCPINGVIHDTMLSGWELTPEFPKSLELQTSIKTLEPFYKFEGKIPDTRTKAIYCAKDCCVTHEIYEVNQRQLETKPESLRHFNMNMGLLSPVMFMELRGFLLDQTLQAEKASEIEFQMRELETRIKLMNYGKGLNPDSPKQMVEALYKSGRYPTQYKMEGGRKTDKPTTDKSALLHLFKKFSNDSFLYSIMSWKKLVEILGQFRVKPDADGRCRGGFNIVGADTGRFTAYKSPTGTGAQLQTITEDCRGIYRADPGYTLFQYDLAGADGWTVAAESAAHKDPTMLEDYLAGNKPAKVIAAMKMYGPDRCRLPVHDLMDFVNSISIEKWLYFACKRVQHGSNYGLGKARMSDQILADSWDETRIPIYMSPDDCLMLQNLYFQRYWGVKEWHTQCQKDLIANGSYTSISGNTRQFFGRRFEHDTFRAFLSHGPQHNTTYITSLALTKLWQDPENRDENNLPIIQPLAQVHDALVGQFPTSKYPWARAKLDSYFNNPVRIAGTDLRIPAEGKFGKSWGPEDLMSNLIP